MPSWREYRDAYKAHFKGERPAFDPDDLPPEHRARYDKAMEEVAQGRAEAEAAHQDFVDRQVLQGPALAPVERMRRQPPEFQGLRHAFKQSWELNREMERAHRGPPRIEDPVEAARVAGAERAARDAARAPYRAPEPPEVAITRFTTRGRSQLDDVIAHLQAGGLAARPDLVHGLYRVPDRISPNLSPNSEAGRPVEWAVVHHPGSVHLPPAEDPVESAGFKRNDQVIARRLGEPGVFDEDVGVLYCAMAGVTPENCFGIARLPEIRQPTSGYDSEGSQLFTNVIGVTVLHRLAARGEEARRRLVEEAPVALHGPPPVHHEILDWEAIQRRVQPEPWLGPKVPSPLPYLPSTPEELLLAYLEVVGVRSADCYAAASTITHRRGLDYAFNLFKGVPPQQPCADGKPRLRLHAGEHVVLQYRDRPEYAEGRARWKRYQAEVLFARLDHRSGKRAPLAHEEEPGTVLKWVGRAMAVANPLDWLDYKLDEAFDEKHSPFPYCWPPVR